MTALPNTIHASCVAIGDAGVLLIGPSGSGKSDLALRLMDRGAVLVADDRCALAAMDGQLLCSPPETIVGKIEVRGIGIIARPWRAPVPVRLAVRLADRYERLPDPQIEVLGGITVAALTLSAFEASAPIKVELALAAELEAA
jgi:serine kinase of HPr protein (carbohydrate metabolism regulator)